MAQFGTKSVAKVSNSRNPSRKRSRSWKFTWNNPPIDFVAQLKNSFGENEYVFQLEKGVKSTVHVQGVMRYPNPMDSWIEIEDVHWAKCSNWRGRDGYKYCIKLDTRIEGPWTNVEGLTWRKSIVDPLHGKELYEWQKDVLDIVMGNVDARKVYWFWERVGNTGKSSLAKHMMMHYNCQVLDGSSKDCFYSIKCYIESRDLDVVIFDLSRSQENRVSYRAIEAIKNGMFFSGKYESSACIFNPPHVFVFANFGPDMNMLSEDRWDVRIVDIL